MESWHVTQFAFAVRGNIWRIIKTKNYFWLGKYARMVALGHYLFLKAHSCPRASLLGNCSLLGTDNILGQLSSPKVVYCLYNATMECLTREERCQVSGVGGNNDEYEKPKWRGKQTARWGLGSVVWSLLQHWGCREPQTVEQIELVPRAFASVAGACPVPEGTKVVDHVHHHGEEQDLKEANWRKRMVGSKVAEANKRGFQIGSKVCW